MERKKKSALCNKVISLFTSLLMVLSTIIGYIPTSAVSVSAADSYPLQEISSGTKLSSLRKYNPKSDILINPTPDKISGYSTNDDFDKNKDGSLWKDKSGRYLRIRTKSGFATFDGKQWTVRKDQFHPTITYYKAGYDKKNKQYYNLTMRVEKYESDGYIWYMADSSTRDKQYSKITTKPECPYIYIDTKKSSVGISGLKNVQCSFTWSKYTEDNGSEDIPADQAAKLNSYITIRDLDDGQAMKIAGNQKGNLDVYKLKGSKFITEQDGWYVSKSGETTSPSDKKSWVQALLTGSPTFIMWFRANEPNKVVHDTEYNEQWGMPANTCYSWNKNNAGMISGNYFEYTAESLINIIPDPEPTPTPGGDPEPNDPSIEKVVVQKGGSYDDAYKAVSPEDAFEINDYDDYDYLIKTAGPGAETDSYEIVDTLEDCLTIDDTHHITITDKDGTNVSNDFNLSIKGQTITASAKADYMKSSDFKKADQEFMVRLTVHRIKTKDVYTFMAPWIANDPENTGYTFYVPNASTVRYRVKDAKETTQLDSEPCWVTDEIKCKLTVEKDAKYDDWKVGDEVSYSVEVTQTKQDGYATNVVVKDTDIPSSLKLVNNGWEVSGPNSGTIPSMSSTEEGNGWILTCPLLQYNESIKITFKCIATADSNGQDWINTVTAEADNFTDDDGSSITASDSAEVWVNSPVLTVDKVADRYEYEVGDTVNYTVSVKNTADYTIAQNVEVSDIDIPEGLELQGDPTIEMGGEDTSIGWPVVDGTTTIATEERDNNVEVTSDGNSWTINAKYLTSKQPLNITFSCIATKAANGVESQNVVSATADNFLSLDENQEPQTAQDDAEVYVNTAYFDIEKTSDAYEWQVGDHVPFNITVKNVNDEGTQDLADDEKYADVDEGEKEKIGAAGKTVARNVIITDKDIPAGFKLDFDSVDVQTGDTSKSVEDEIDEQLAALDNDTEQSMTEDEILANAGIDLDEDGTDSDGDTDLDLPELNGDQDGTGDSGDTDLPDGTDPEEHEPTPAEEMTVTGIPDSFDDHVAGTADKTNDVDESLWNETVTTPITKELTQVGNGWELKISNLPAGNDVNIRFTCEALEAGNGAEGVNVGTVSATNGIEKSDDAEAYINTAALSIDKQMVNKYAAGGEEDAQDGREGYEFRVGDDVEYKLVVNNNQKGSIARNVVISDTTIPVGMELDESSITVEGVPETYVNPVAGTDDPANQLDPDHYNETSVEPVNYNVERVNGGFQVTIDNLPCTTGDTLNNVTTPVVITYHCTPGSILNGYEVINTGKAAADNASEVKDSERIWINSPELKVIKDSDRYEYMIGDTVTYQVDVTQEQAGCLARDITITDVIDTEGVKLQKNSIVLIDEDGNKIEPESVEVNGNTFTVNTGRNLINNKSGYTTVDMSKADDEKGDSGYFQNGEYNPLGIDKESKLTLEYAVEITDEDLAGQSIHNTVTANSKENIPVEDEHEVLVYGPALDIVKESDKVEYQVGEKAQYKLTIRELRDNITAKQVVVTDTFEKEGMKISKINVRLNGEKLDGAEIEQTADNAFVINTGADLTIEDKLEVFYTVVFTDPSLHDQDIVNVATAKGENTEEERQDNCVHIVDETPGLQIKKSSDKTSYKVGETGHYTVVVSNTEKGTTARNVIIKDALQVEGAKIVDGSIKIYNDAGKLMDDAEIEHSDTDYAIATGHDLEYKERFAVNYDVLFEAETLAGKDILNVARATCDNLRVETKTPSPIKLANGLEVYKSADPATGSVVKNGDTINYSINVKNTSNDDMKNVLVKDMIPEYTEYASSEEQDGVITGTRTLNDKLYATFVIESLPAGEEKTVSFAVTVTDAPQEAMILNVAQVRVTKFALDDQTDNTWTHEAFRNTNETVHYTDTRWVKDQNVVYIDGGKLSIEKSSDKMNYSVGETGHYTVSVKQKVEGAVARNVVVADKLQKKGAYIQKDSIKAYILREGAEEPEEIEDVQLVAKDFEYTLYTNTNLKYGEEILVKYDVLFKDAELEGQQIKNVALTKDDSTVPGDEPTDTNRVTVGDAGLIIAKSSDKTKYKVGDVGKYTLKVTAADQSRTIKNVVVKDVMKQKGAHLVTGTVRTYYDNEELKVDVLEKDNGFVVETKHDLSGTHAIYVTYDVVFEEASLDGRDVTNIATTWGDNTNPSDDEHTVHVGDGDTPDTPDKPDKPDTPDTPDKPGVGGMTITKTANKNEVSVGDVVSYTLSAIVNSGKETAKNVVITDTLDADLFEHLEIVKDSFRSYLDDSEFHGADLSISSTGFTLKSGKDMKPGQVMKVTYDVKVKDDTLKGKTFKNIATVSSDNMDTAKDKESVKVKTDDPVEGGMTISKKANQSKVSVGDTVSYTLEAKVNSGTDTAKNVVIKDTVDSAYAKYVSIDRSSVHCYIDNSEFAPKSLDVTENGFTVTSGKDLKPGQVMKVTYDMKVVSDKLKGKSIKNAAVVSSDNMNPGNDTEIVEVPSDKPVTGGLNLTKIGDHSQINVGDTVKYTLIGKTTSADTAVNVVIKDALDNKGVIDESSIKAYLDDQLFTPKKLSVTDDGFTMETGKDLAAKQILKVTYSVRFADESLAGKTVKNTAVISSDNMDPVDADHGVTVNPKEEEKPALSIDKSVNLSSASVGDTLSYTLTVKETEKDQTAKNVVVRDNFDTTGMKVGGIQATLDGKSIKADVTKADNGFVVNTNTDLAYGSTLKITYQAVVSDSSLAGKMVGNTAIASADNADDVAANAGVSIAENPSPSETPAPSTTPAPGADSSDNTTNTVGPKTGLVNHAGMYAGIGLGIVAVAAIAVFVMRRKKK